MYNVRVIKPESWPSDPRIYIDGQRVGGDGLIVSVERGGDVSISLVQGSDESGIGGTYRAAFSLTENDFDKIIAVIEEIRREQDNE